MIPYKPFESRSVWPQAAPAVPQEQISSVCRLTYVTPSTQQWYSSSSQQLHRLQQQPQQHMSIRPLSFSSPKPQQTKQPHVCDGSSGFTGFPPWSRSVAFQPPLAFRNHQTRGDLQEHYQQVLVPFPALTSILSASRKPSPSCPSAAPSCRAYVHAAPSSQQMKCTSLFHAVPKYNNFTMPPSPVLYIKRSTGFEWPQETRQGKTPVALGASSSSSSSFSSSSSNSCSSPGREPTAVALLPTATHARGRRTDVPSVSAAGGTLMPKASMAASGTIAGNLAAAAPSAAAAAPSAAAPAPSAAARHSAANQHLLSKGAAALQNAAPTETPVGHGATTTESLNYQAKRMDVAGPCADAHGSISNTPTPLLCATPLSLDANAIPLRSFSISSPLGAVQPTWRGTAVSPSGHMPSRLLYAHAVSLPSSSSSSSQTATAGVETSLGGDMAASLRATASAAAPGEGWSAKGVAVDKPLRHQPQGERVQTTYPMQSQLPQQFRLEQNLVSFSTAKQQEGGGWPFLSPVGAEELSMSNLHHRQIRSLLESKRQQQKAGKSEGIAKRNEARGFQTASFPALHDVKREEVAADDETCNREICNNEEACCSGALGAAGLFSLDITAVCQTPLTSLHAAQAALLQQERKRIAFGSALRELFAAERQAQMLVDGAKEIAARRRKRAPQEVEAAQVACRAFHEEEWKKKMEKFEEDTAAVRAKVEELADIQLNTAQEGLLARQSEAADLIINKVLEVDTRCPLEALKRFASPRRQLAFYEARVSQKKQVVHHPPGDRLRMEKDVIIWDDEGYAKLEHISADKRTSVTQLGSFWVRHQARVQQHSDRPLVLLTTQRWPGEGAGEESEGEGGPAQREGSASSFPPLRSLSEVHSTPPPRSRSSKPKLSPSATKTQESGEISEFPPELKEHRESSGGSAEPSKSED